MTNVKYFLYLLVFLPSSLLACDLPDDYVPINERAPRALLFEVSGCDLPVTHVFGTYHSDSPKLLQKVDALAPYIAASKRFMMEIIQSPENQLKAQRALTLPASSPNLEQLLGKELFDRVASTFEPVLPFPREVMQRFQPWALALLAQYPPAEADGVILDTRLQQIAAIKAVPLQALEELEEQFAVFREMEPAMQRDFLISTLDEFDEVEALLAQLESHYLNQDLWAIAALSRDSFDAMAENYPEMAAYLERELIDVRNARMGERILLKQAHPLFIAVGALHLPGQSGILSQLEAQGRQITPIRLDGAGEALQP